MSTRPRWNASPANGSVGFASDGRADAKLGEHLITFHWRGRLQPALLERWFELADDDVAARVMDFLGRTLNNTEGDINPEVLQRIRQLWDSRLDVIGSDAHEDDKATPSQAHSRPRSSTTTGHSQASKSRCGPEAQDGGRRLTEVIERLAKFAAAKPAEASRYTLRMLEGAANDWDHLGCRDQVRDVMAATNHATDPETLNNRKAIVDHYVTRGDHEFRGYIQAQP